MVVRDGVTFQTQLNDYVQWLVFAGLPDNSWRVARPYLHDGSTILDIGANCGSFTLRIAHAACRKRLRNVSVHAFEPNPYVREFLEENLALNQHLKDLVAIHPIGLGDQEGEFHLVFHQSNSGGGQISASAEKGITVQLDTLDRFVEKHDFQRISFIKIDVEGFEPLVIKGGKATIEKHRPSMFIEITDSWFEKYGYTEQDLLEYLGALDYQLLVEHSNDFVPLDVLGNKRLQLGQYNLLAVRPAGPGSG